MKARALVTLAALALAAVACGSSGTNTTTAPPSPSATATTTPSATSSASPTTTPKTPLPATAAADDTTTAVFPVASSSTRYTDPVAAATGFATEYAGFVDPVVGAFQQGDSRSGEVQVRPLKNGPVTTVFVRQLGKDDSWWVLGSATAAIRLSTPDWFAQVSSPVTVAGESSAFEGTVQTQVREDGRDAPLGSGFVTGGSMALGPFTGTLAFSRPTQQYGALVLYTDSQQGTPSVHTWEIAVLRIRFAG